MTSQVPCELIKTGVGPREGQGLSLSLGWGRNMEADRQQMNLLKTCWPGILPQSNRNFYFLGFPHR